MSERSLRLEVILQAIDKATAPLKLIEAGSSKVARAVKAARDELKNLERGQRHIATFKDLQAGVQGTSEKLNAAQQHLRNMQAQLRAGGGDTAKFRNEFTKAHEAVRDLTQRVQEQRRELAPHAQKLREAGISIARLGTHESEVAAKIKTATAALEEQQKKLEAVGIARGRYAKAMAARDSLAGTGVRLGATSAAIGATMSVPIKAYAEAEDAATQLRVAMMRTGGVVSAEYARINDLAVQLGDRLPGTTAEFQNMMTMLIRQGMAPKAILGGLGEATAYLGVQLNLSSAEAAEFAAKLQDATRTAEGDMMGLMDMIQRTFYVGVDKSNMLNAFTKLSPALDTIRMQGLAGAQALAPLVAVLDQAGLQGEAAGNALRKVLQKSMDTDKIRKALADLQKSKGIAISMDFTDGKGEFGGLDKLFAQMGKLQALSSETRTALIKDLYGDDSEVTQAVSTILAKGKAGYEDMLQKMADQAAIQDRVNAQLGTLRNLWDATSGTFTNFMVSLGESIGPELKAITEWLGNAAGAARRFATEHPALTGALMKTVGVVGLLTAGFSTLLLSLAAIAGPFAFLRYGMSLTNVVTGGLGTKLWAIAQTVFPAIGKGLLWIGRLFLMNPIGLAVTGIATAAFLIYKYWDPIKAFFSNLWEGVKGSFAAASDWMRGKLAGWITYWSPVLEFVETLPARFTDFGSRIIDGLVSGISGGMGRVREVIASIGRSITGVFEKDQEIHSPSRVWAELGGQTMSGLALGILNGQNAPLAAIVRASRQITAAGAIGLAGAGTAIAAPDAMGFRIDNRPPLAAAAPAGSSGVTNVAYTINITAGAGTDEAALRRLFRDELERHKRELEARARSSLSDRY